jgi:hypothetical protein
MPCWTVSTTTVEWGIQTDLNLLKTALESIGYVVSIENDTLVARNEYGGYVQFSFGSLTFSKVLGKDFNAQVKRAYSEEVIKYAAKKQSWQLKKVDRRKYVALRSY